MTIPEPVEEILFQLDLTANSDDGFIDDDTRRAARKAARVIRGLYEHDEIEVEKSELDSPATRRER